MGPEHADDLGKPLPVQESFTQSVQNLNTSEISVTVNA